MLPYQSAIIEDGIVTGFRELHSDVVFPKDIGKVGPGPNDLEAFSYRHVKGPKIRTLVLPESVTLFGCHDIEFDGCRGLETLVFPVSLSTLNYSALFRCTASTIVLLSRELTMRDGTIDSMDCLVVAPNLPLSAFRPADKEKAVSTVIRQFAEFVGDAVLVGHNIKSSDLYYISRAAQRAGLRLENPFFDTYRYAKQFKAQRGWEKLSLEYLSEQFGISQPDAHRAWCDAEANVGVYWKLREL